MMQSRSISKWPGTRRTSANGDRRGQARRRQRSGFLADVAARIRHQDSVVARPRAPPSARCSISAAAERCPSARAPVPAHARSAGALALKGGGGAARHRDCRRKFCPPARFVSWPVQIGLVNLLKAVTRWPGAADQGAPAATWDGGQALSRQAAKAARLGRRRPTGFSRGSAPVAARWASSW